MSKKDFSNNFSNLYKDDKQETEINTGKEQGKNEINTREIQEKKQKGKTKNNKVISFLADGNTYEEIKAIAFWEREYKSDFINEIFKDYIKKYKKKHKEDYMKFYQSKHK